MKRKYTKVKPIAHEILRHQEEGKTYREIGSLYGLSIKQVKNLLYRHRSNIRNTVELNHPPKRRGRPQTKLISTNSELKLEVKRLKMENDLLRNFLQSIGRR